MMGWDRNRSSTIMGINTHRTTSLGTMNNTMVGTRRIPSHHSETGMVTSFLGLQKNQIILFKVHVPLVLVLQYFKYFLSYCIPCILLQKINNKKLCIFFSIGNPTNFGLHEKLQSKWKDQIADEVKGDYLSTYQNSFVGHPKENLVRNRYAFSKDMSTTLHPYNKVNKDLHLRNACVFKSPEKLPDLVYT